MALACCGELWLLWRDKTCCAYLAHELESVLTITVNIVIIIIIVIVVIMIIIIIIVIVVIIININITINIIKLCVQTTQRLNLPYTHLLITSWEGLLSSLLVTSLLLFLSMLHTAMQAKEPDKQWDVTCSYCEVYNELIFDLLQESSPPLDLRLLHCADTLLLAAHAMKPNRTR